MSLYEEDILDILDQAWCIKFNRRPARYNIYRAYDQAIEDLPAFMEDSIRALDMLDNKV